MLNRGKEFNKICKGCNKKFTATIIWQVFCNKKCKNNFYIRRKVVIRD